MLYSLYLLRLPSMNLSIRQTRYWNLSGSLVFTDFGSSKEERRARALYCWAETTRPRWIEVGSADIACFRKEGIAVRTMRITFLKCSFCVFCISSAILYSYSITASLLVSLSIFVLSSLKLLSIWLCKKLTLALTCSTQKLSENCFLMCSLTLSMTCESIRQQLASGLSRQLSSILTSMRSFTKNVSSLGSYKKNAGLLKALDIDSRKWVSPF